MADEREILERYSTPGLRKHELTHSEKKAHLASLRCPLTGQKTVTREEAEKILATLYPKETRELTEAQIQVLEIIKENADIAHRVLRDWIAKRFAEIERVVEEEQ